MISGYRRFGTPPLLYNLHYNLHWLYSPARQLRSWCPADGPELRMSWWRILSQALWNVTGQHGFAKPMVAVTWGWAQATCGSFRAPDSIYWEHVPFRKYRSQFASPKWSYCATYRPIFMGGWWWGVLHYLKGLTSALHGPGLYKKKSDASKPEPLRPHHRW